ncbi:methyltransferase [Salidesulfovibrio onnuriiensis]|uniref:methyltransferase n=1 Tax=Salidesulfovibrio onnuriiensis TaxID=2583823 RepID=UPI0011C883FD|nr:methyltransferase [Salidesulfovibrio onnuriiensis]
MTFPLPKTSLSPVENILMDTIACQAVMNAVRMRLFDHLETPADAPALAAALELKKEPLEALLDLLVHRELLRVDGKAYANTEMSGEYLVSTSPLYQGQALELQFQHNDALRQDLPAMLRGETPARDQTDAGWGENDIMEGTLQHALNGQLQKAVRFIAALPEFDSFRTMADIGGNHGHYSMELLERNPDLKSTILDLPHVIEPAAQRCRDKGFGERVTCEPFDLRENSLPDEAYDLVFTSHILYACKDTLEQVFRDIYQSLKPGGCFATHHFAPEGGASEHYKRNVELLTRLMGYDSHFLSYRELEKPLLAAGFKDLSHTFTGADGQTLLLVARKK